MCLGMGLAYLGAFATPEPHHLPVAVVGAGPEAKVFAQTVKDKAGDKLDVRTVADRAVAVDQLKHRDITGAYVLNAKAPELIVASAGSDMSATAVTKVFTPVATAQGVPLKVTDVVPPVSDDPTGSGIFFLLIAVSIGSYASVAALGAAGAGLSLKMRAALVTGVSFAVSVIGAAFAGPLFHLVDHGLWGVWAMSWLYSAGILFLGVGLHTFLKRWTTLAVMVLFVMLNFTSSGGLFRPELQNGFFGGLHAFWNGAGLVEGIRDLVYFDSHGLTRDVWVLAVWLVLGLAVIALAGLAERRRSGAAAPAAAEVAPPAAVAAAPAEKAEKAEEAEAAEEEIEEAVGV
uniref:ABC transporter permease n=1 Tax=Streptomyces sp. NBC_00003 TaxID=2903608 RepID=A0AAU2VGS6_9ACTN